MILHERRPRGIAAVVEIRARGGVIPFPYQPLQILGQAAALSPIVSRGGEAIERRLVVAQAQQEARRRLVVEQLPVSPIADLVVGRPGRRRRRRSMIETGRRLARAPDRALAVRYPELVQQLLVTHDPRLLLAPLPLELPGQLVDLVRDYRVELGQDVVRPIADVLHGVAAPAPGGVLPSRAFRGR